MRDLENREWQFDCLGCAIGRGEMIPPGGLIAETQNFVAHQDPEVPIPAFVIVAAKRHVRSITEMSGREASELFELVYHARLAIQQVEPDVQVTLIQEERSGHFHLWLLPRYPWMPEQFPNSLSALRDLMAYARTNWKTEQMIQAVRKDVEAIRQVMGKLPDQ